MAQARSIPIWRYYTADQPAKTKVTRHVPTRKHVLPKLIYSLDPKQAGQPVRHRPQYRRKWKTKVNNILTKMFKTLGKKRSTSRVQPVLEVLDQCIGVRFGDVCT